jgi:hypothetical protein
METERSSKDTPQEVKKRGRWTLGQVEWLNCRVDKEWEVKLKGSQSSDMLQKHAKGRSDQDSQQEDASGRAQRRCSPATKKVNRRVSLSGLGLAPACEHLNFARPMIASPPYRPIR